MAQPTPKLYNSSITSAEAMKICDKSPSINSLSLIEDLLPRFAMSRYITGAKEDLYEVTTHYHNVLAREAIST